MKGSIANLLVIFFATIGGIDAALEVDGKEEDGSGGEVGQFTAGSADVMQKRFAREYGTKTEVTNSIGMKLRLIPPGEFSMGSAVSATETVRSFGEFKESERMFNIEHPQHRIIVSKPFYLGMTEVTQRQWTTVMGSQPWSEKENVRSGPDFPAVYVSWDAAVEFCKRLSKLEGETYRLPTEAEWEYACRACTETVFHFGDDASELSGFAWWGGATGNGNCVGEEYPHRIQQKKPNGFGLYDMHGNVCEWCYDKHDEFYYYYMDSPQKDPMGPKTGCKRIVRGGCWSAPAVFNRSASRVPLLPRLESCNIGFRIAADLKQPHARFQERGE